MKVLAVNRLALEQHAHHSLVPLFACEGQSGGAALTRASLSLVHAFIIHISRATFGEGGS